MLGDEIGDVAADEIAIEARLVDLDRVAVRQVKAVANAAASQKAMEFEHPVEDLILLAAAPVCPEYACVQIGGIECAACRIEGETANPRPAIRHAANGDVGERCCFTGLAIDLLDRAGT
jgi:hypothetical protein